MNLIVLNPNTTKAMTDAVVAQAMAYLPAATAITPMTATEGCAVIDSRETFAIGGETALQMLAGIPPQNSTAILLACFGDPGLARLRESTSMPVTSLAEPAILKAFARGDPFAIVTAGNAWIDMLSERVQECGASELLVGVYALAANGREMQKNPPAFRAEVMRLSIIAADAGAKILMLGGAAFACLQFEVDSRLQLIDPVEAAVEAAVLAVQSNTSIQ